MDFNDILGHEDVIRNLKRAMKKGNVSHSYLFVGPEAVGKKRVAMAFSKALLCENGGLEPCNKCTSCRKFDSSNHPDFYYVEPIKDSIKKEQIEEIIKTMLTRPLEGKRKVYFIDDSYTMNRHSQNAFLKTLEEPPSYVNIILISTSSKNLLPTIISRCEVIKFSPLENHEIINFAIERYKKTREEAEFLSSYSKGSIGRTIELLENDQFLKIREDTINIIDGVLKGDELKVLNSLVFFDENEENCEEILDMVLYWFRDLYIYNEIGESDLIINRDKMELLSTQTFLSRSKINDIIELVLVTKENIQRKVNYQLSIETMLLRMQEE